MAHGFTELRPTHRLRISLSAQKRALEDFKRKSQQELELRQLKIAELEEELREATENE